MEIGFYYPGCCLQTQWDRNKFVEGLRVHLLTVVVRELPWPDWGHVLSKNLCSLRKGWDNRKCTLVIPWSRLEIKLSGTDFFKSHIVFLSPQILYSQNMRPWGSLVLLIPACICSFACSALQLILQPDGKWWNSCPEIFKRQDVVVWAYFVLHFQKFSTAMYICTGCCISGGRLPRWTSLKLMFLISAKLLFPELLLLLYSLNKTMTLPGSSVSIARKINCSAQKTELIVQRLPSAARCLFAAESWRESKKRRRMEKKISWLMFMFLIYKNET